MRESRAGSTSVAPALRCHACHHVQSNGRQRATDDDHCRLDDARLLKGNLRERMAKMLFVVQRDGGYGADRRNEHVGRVEAAAEADFDHSHLDAFATEDFERDCRRGLQRTSVGQAARRVAAASSAQSRTSSEACRNVSSSIGRVPHDETLAR
jgi:hypothetical protein